MSTDDPTRRGYDSEVRRHRDNLARALSEVQRAAEDLTRRVNSGEQDLASPARQLLTDAGDVSQAAAALEAASQLDFTVTQ